MKGSPLLSSLFPNLFEISRPITAGSSPLIISANLLYLDRVQMLPIVQGLQPRVDENTKIKMFATFGGPSALKAILQTDPRDYMKLLWTPCQEMPIWIGSVKYSDTFDRLLSVFDATKFGDAAVEDGHIPALVTLREVLSLYERNTLVSHLRASDVGSDMVSISSDSLLPDALSLMLKQRVRRVFISARNKTAENFHYVSSRDVLQFLFSPSRLEGVRTNPEHWLHAKLSEIETHQAKIIRDGKTVNQAAKEMGDDVADCLVCENSGRVVSRWDLVMKPWRNDRFSFSED